MTDKLELPEGVSVNKQEDDSLEILIPYEIANTWKCNKCFLGFESVVLGENNRYQGIIRVIESQKILWQEKLPKKSEEAKNHLNKNFLKKIDSHKKGH